MKIIPVGKWMLIDKVETRKPSVILINEDVDVDDNVLIGVVTMIGDEVEKYKVDDKFIYEKHVITRFKYKDTWYFLTQEKYPLAKIEL